MRRLKLFAFYQIMAFTSLVKPKAGEEMIEFAQEESWRRDVKYTLENVFGHARKGKRV